MREDLLVSVIVPCYNSSKYIGVTLRCLQGQTYKNWECVIVDDGSTDNSAALIREFVDKDERFRYFYQENGGSASAKNTGLQHAKGEFIQFLDADDIILKNKLQVCLDKFSQSPETNIVYTDFCFYSNDTSRLKQDQGAKEKGSYYQTLPVEIPSADRVYSFIFEWNVDFIIPIHSYMFKKKVFKKIMFEDRFKSFMEDLYCWIMIAEAEFTFEYIDDVLAVYRHVDTSSTTKETAVINSRIMMIHNLIEDERFAKYRERLKNSLHYFYQRLVMGLFMEREFRDGLRMFVKESKHASIKGIVKMIGWFLLMIFLRKETAVKIRLWLVKKTPLKWGGWSHFKLWVPPHKIEI